MSKLRERFVDHLTFEDVRIFMEDHGITGDIIYFPFRKFDLKRMEIPDYRRYIVITGHRNRVFLLRDDSLKEEGNDNFKFPTKIWKEFMYSRFGKKYYRKYIKPFRKKIR